MRTNIILFITNLVLICIFNFDIYGQINIKEKEIVNISIDTKINNVSLFKKNNFKTYKTKFGNKVLHGQSQNSDLLTSISIFFDNSNNIETIKIWIPIVNQDETKNEIATNVADKITYQIFNKDIRLWDWGFETNNSEQYSFYKEKMIEGKRVIFLSVLPDLIVIIITTDLNFDFKSTRDKYEIEKK